MSWGHPLMKAGEEPEGLGNSLWQDQTEEDPQLLRTRQEGIPNSSQRRGTQQGPHPCLPLSPDRLRADGPVR